MELVTEVMKGLRQRIMEVDWLDDETRQLSIEKVYKHFCSVLYYIHDARNYVTM